MKNRRIAAIIGLSMALIGLASLLTYFILFLEFASDDINDIPKVSLSFLIINISLCLLCLCLNCFPLSFSERSTRIVTIVSNSVLITTYCILVALLGFVFQFIVFPSILSIGGMVVSNVFYALSLFDEKSTDASTKTDDELLEEKLANVIKLYDSGKLSQEEFTLLKQSYIQKYSHQKTNPEQEPDQI